MLFIALAQPFLGKRTLEKFRSLFVAEIPVRILVQLLEWQSF